jgi:3-deoxy-7-phosphoheptulonate synthase
MIFNRKLPIPQEIKAEYPLSPDLIRIKEKRDADIQDIFLGKSNKFLIIIGPCSADREEPVMEYIYRLARLQEKVADKIVIIPRVYTNKPRSTGDGYMGMVHQPNPFEKEDILDGLILVRKLHIRVIAETGFTSADEMLYPENFRYLSDLLSYTVVGARSVENQQHRLTASGLEIPVGMKNPLSGDLSAMLNSVHSAQLGHTFLYRGWEVNSTGNPLAHPILRGAVDNQGKNIPNYHYENLNHLCELYSQKHLLNMSLIIDVNHSNSGKRYLEQIRICKDVLHSCRHLDAIRKILKGFMIESYIEDGSQDPRGSVFGQSITDACLGWEKSERLVLEIADLL